MRTSKIFSKDNGDKYEVSCSLYSDSYSNNVMWKVYVAKKAKGKRKFTFIGYSDDKLRYMNVPRNKYLEYNIREYLKEIPWKWIEDTANEVITKLRVSIDALKPEYV